MSDKESKLAAGSIITMLGSVILRLGGFIYRFILSRLLTTAEYGIVGLTLPFQNTFIIAASGGIPPAIAKYVSQYKAVDDKRMVHQISVTGMKLMIFLSIIAAIIMLLISEPVAMTMWHKPEAILPLRLVSLIVPFSVIVGALRGIFQGFYNMQDLFYSKFIEQIATLILASSLVFIGWYAAGAVLGTALGFLVSLLGSYYLYKRDIKDVYLTEEYDKLSFKEESQIMIQIFKFSIPVVISGIAEIILYDSGTFFIGIFLPALFAGLYTNATAISRIPLIIANSISISVLPATSEADSLADEKLLKMYIHQAYRYTSLTSLPVTAFIIVYSLPLMSILFGENFAGGAGALSISASGMFFFSMYLIASSMCQGLGKPSFPMYSLIVGAIISIVSCVYLIPLFDIRGASLATTIATFILMLMTIFEVTHLTKVHPPYKDLLKILIITIIMMIIMNFAPKTLLGMIVGGAVASIIYIFLIVYLKAIKSEDMTFVEHIANKTGPLKKYLNKVIVRVNDHIES
ncbi:MAG: O-antigen and teichoic acid export protein [Methanosphaera sp. rholeuAM130]|nr:flippase [Methanosphaera sp.]RAP54519.1 MAG: O-antigen and teichoic acid export protein [Methanosphaera sp. rholeuAM130]